jgi:hypothetical protein
MIRKPCIANVIGSGNCNAIPKPYARGEVHKTGMTAKTSMTRVTAGFQYVDQRGWSRRAARGDL